MKKKLRAAKLITVGNKTQILKALKGPQLAFRGFTVST